MTKKSQQKAWEKAISLMSRDELQFVVDHPEGYYPKFWDMARVRLNKLIPCPHHEVMRTVAKNCLDELGCPCEIEEDGVLAFWFQGSHFHMFLEPDSHYMDIWEYCWRSEKLDDVDAVRRLMTAINDANSSCSITSVYTIDEEDRTIDVSCSTSILYRPMITDLKHHLSIRLSNFFYAHELINAAMALDKGLSERQQRAAAGQNHESSLDVLQRCLGSQDNKKPN